MPRILLLD